MALMSVPIRLCSCAVPTAHDDVEPMSPKLLARVTPQMIEREKDSGFVTTRPCARQMDVRNAKDDTCTEYVNAVPGTQLAVLGKIPEGHVGALVNSEGQPVQYEEAISSAACSNPKLKRGEALDQACEKPINLKQPEQCAYLKQSDMCDALGSDPAFLVAVAEVKIGGLMKLLEELTPEQQARDALVPRPLAEFRATHLRAALGQNDDRLPLELCDAPERAKFLDFRSSMLLSALERVGAENPKKQVLNELGKSQSSIAHFLMKELAVAAGCRSAGEYLATGTPIAGVTFTHAFINKDDNFKARVPAATRSKLWEASQKDLEHILERAAPEVQKRRADQSDAVTQHNSKCYKGPCSDEDMKRTIEPYEAHNCVIYNAATHNPVYKNPECANEVFSAALLRGLEACRSGPPLYNYGILRENHGSDAARIWCSPLVLDLNGDGRVTRPGGRWHFDLTANGTLERMDWIGEGDAWLARDIDGSGCIESGAELFGEVTRLPNGQRARDGFEALAVFDKNSDGQVDAAEAKAAGIVLWKDNGDAVCTPNELRTFEDERVASVSVTAAPSTEQDAAGNRWLLQSAFTRSSGRQGTVVDVFFQVRD